MKNTATPLSLLSPALAQTQINRLRERLKHELSDLQSELKLLPEGSLYIKKSRNWITFYICHNGKTKGITKDKQLIYQLARRH